MRVAGDAGVKKIEQIHRDGAWLGCGLGAAITDNLRSRQRVTGPRKQSEGRALAWVTDMSLIGTIHLKLVPLEGLIGTKSIGLVPSFIRENPHEKKNLER